MGDDVKQDIAAALRDISNALNDMLTLLQLLYAHAMDELEGDDGGDQA